MKTRKRSGSFVESIPNLQGFTNGFFQSSLTSSIPNNDEQEQKMDFQLQQII